ncbi:MAG: nitric-oxide reductase large subunit [Candidatus Melainabacteria bacterium]|nr:nitric-oxide reductase large subunit [Candidatus Obscuribacter sp.]MBK9277294.1 nitric-oxide reductase large subunit [Candidatus Obscuribacter sp.]MBL8086030.1 nitric-oxide reductase large subunit [Candidatus Obscuribacter sp.]RTL37279.1 MAG: nitric-oxide reductase large subunit [Candidatus Melainabacteria bacterium]
MSWRWKLSVLLVLIAGFSTLIFMGHETSNQAPPIPERVVDSSGKVLFLSNDIMAGQGVFQKYGLMDVGSFFGHGAYNGVDFSADYLHREAVIALDYLAQSKFKKNFDQLDASAQGQLLARVHKDFKENRYNPETKTLTLTEEQAVSYQKLIPHYDTEFGAGNKLPLPPDYIKDKTERLQLTRFFAWGAWVCSTQRPGKDYTYTNNWPPDAAAGNAPNWQIFFWSAMSLIMLVGGIGLTQFLLSAFPGLGWAPDGSGEMVDAVKTYRPFRSQTSLYPYFVVVVLLFLFQTAFGVVTAHYIVEQGFYGFDIRSIFPYSITRSWHLQLSIFWIATAWLAAGMFMAPMLSKHEPKGQHWLVKILFVAILIVAVGSICGEWLGVKNMLGSLWFWFGHQGWEYLELGRFWQALLTLGMLIWAVIVFRSIAPLLKGKDHGSLPYMLLYGVLAIPLFFSFGMMYHPGTNFAVADFWRWWVVHLWVEGIFELYTTIIVAYFFCSLGMVSEKSALSVIYVDIILYLGSGIVGIGHHYYWTAQPAINMALGSMISALEVVPLTLLTMDAWKFVHLAKVEGSIKNFSHYWAMMFLIAVGFWNFLGAGVFGFLINTPIVSYYEHATYLTSNHGHAALMGVYGMLSVAAILFSTRYLMEDSAWNNKLAAISFWGLNIGLMLMLVLNIFPAGIIQMIASYQHGFWFARSPEFVHSNLFQVFTWLRVAGDLIFVLAGVFPLVYLVLKGMFHLRKAADTAKGEV